MPGEAGHDEIAQPRRATAALAQPAEALAHKLHLGHDRREIQGAEVVAHTGALNDTHAERRDIFPCRAALDPGHIRALTDVEAGALKQRPYMMCRRCVLTRRHAARGHGAGDLLRVGGAGQNGDTAARRGIFRDDLAHAEAASMLQALDSGDEKTVRRDERGDERSGRAQCLGGNSEQENTGRGCLPVVVRDGYGTGQRYARQRGIFAAFPQKRSLFLAACPKRHRVSVIDKADRQRRCPCAAARNKNLHSASQSVREPARDKCFQAYNEAPSLSRRRFNVLMFFVIW